jgi:putative transposase
VSQMINIVPGVTVEKDGQRYVITHLLDLEAVIAKAEETGRTERLYIKDLTPPTPQRNDNIILEKRPDKELTLIEDKDWQEAQRRFALIRPLLTAPRRTREMVTKQAQDAGVHTATLYRWIDAYERTGRVSALLPGKRGSSRGVSRLDSEVEKILRATIQDYYISKRKPSIQETCQKVEERCQNAGLTPPHPHTIRNRIAALTDRDKLKRSRGYNSG